MNSSTNLLFLGLPDTGKTTFFVALDEVLLRQTAVHGLTSGGFSANRNYIETAKKAWRAGKAVERTKRLTIDEPVELLVQHPTLKTTTKITAPDVNGEFFDGQWIDRKWPTSYRLSLADVGGLFLFINAATSGANAEMSQAWSSLPQYFSETDFSDLGALVAKLKNPEDEVSKFVSSKLSHKTKGFLNTNLDFRKTPDSVRACLIEDFNQIIDGDSIYEKNRFSKTTLRPQSQRLISQMPQKKQNAFRLNKLLLEDAYPSELSKKVPKDWDARSSAKQIKLVDLLQFTSELGNTNERLPLAVMISAWDLIETFEKPKTDPEVFLKREWSLLHQYLVSNPAAFSYRVYGVSARGGSNDAQSDLVLKIPHERVWLKDGSEVSRDLTRPLKWMLNW